MEGQRFVPLSFEFVNEFPKDKTHQSKYPVMCLVQLLGWGCGRESHPSGATGHDPQAGCSE